MAKLNGMRGRTRRCGSGAQRIDDRDPEGRPVDSHPGGASQRGCPRLAAVRHAADDAAERFVSDNREWILRAQQKVRMASPPVEPLVDGGRVLLWGVWREVRLGEGPRALARPMDGVIEIVAPDEDGRTKALEDLYRREIRAEASRLHDHWAAITGRAGTTLAYRRMTTRWGSCNTRTGKITLNISFGRNGPRDLLEYIVVHELAHLWERGHGPRFYDLMDGWLPDWKQRRAALREHP